MTNKPVSKEKLAKTSTEEISMTEETPVQKVEQSREEKKRLRRAMIENMGPLHLDDRYKKPGFRQRLVNIGNVADNLRKGYTPIQYIEGADVGSSINEQHTPGGHLEVEVGRLSSHKAVWMEIKEEDAQILDEIRDDLAREQNSMIYKSDIPEDVRVGKIHMEQ